MQNKTQFKPKQTQFYKPLAKIPASFKQGSSVSKLYCSTVLLLKYSNTLALDLCRPFSNNDLRIDRPEKCSSQIWRIFMNRRQFLKTGTMAAGCFLLSSCNVATTASRPAKKRPNILMITCHDLGRHLGCYGIKEVKSPNIDKLATKGIRFANMFSTTPVCSPARGALHTGRYPQSNGLMGLTHAPWWWKFNKGEKHTAMILRDAGYETCLCGLQHVFGSGEAKKYGYQRVLTAEDDAEDRTKAASKFLKGSRANDKPFFLKVGFFEVHRRKGGFQHHQYDPAKPVFIPKYLANTPAIRRDLSGYQEDISYVDACIGRILDALESNEKLRNTIVVFTADHGIPYPGAKWGLRTNAKPRREVYAQFTPAMYRDNESRCIVTERYKLIRYFQAGRCFKYPIDVNPVRFAQHTERAANTGKPRPYVQLFDVKNDPDQFNDIADEKENAAIVKSLSKKLYDWMASVGDPLLKGPLPTPYYERSMEAFKKTTQ
jgi:arylsulfatase A-like enzyme